MVKKRFNGLTVGSTNYNVSERRKIEQRRYLRNSGSALLLREDHKDYLGYSKGTMLRTVRNLGSLCDPLHGEKRCWHFKLKLLNLQHDY